MKTIREFVNPKDLNDLHSVIHDRFFEVDRVFRDDRAAVVVIPFSAPPSSQPEPALKRSAGLPVMPSQRSEVEWLLRIHGVMDHVINDSEKIGWYDFNVIRYDSRRNTILVLTGIPLRFEVTVREFRLTLEETGRPYFGGDR